LETENFIVLRNCKKIANKEGFRVSTEYLEALNALVKNIVEEGVYYARVGKKKTLQERDLKIGVELAHNNLKSL